MPTNWVGNQAPLVCAPPGTQAGFLTLSQDGRFLLLTGYGGTPGQLTNSLLGILKVSTNQSFSSSYTTNVVTEEDIPRVVGLVDRAGNFSTQTTLTNRSEDSDDIRGAASLEGTNIWVVGSANAADTVRYTTRGSMLETQVCANTSLSPARSVGIFGSKLYVGNNTKFMTPTNTAFLTNPYGGSNFSAVLPVVSIPTNFVPISSVGPISAEGFVMFSLNGGAPDTLYLADGQTNYWSESRNFGGAILKYCYTNGVWTSEGAIGAEDAFGVTGYQNGQNVTLYITEGTNNTLYTYTDTTGFGGQPSSQSIAAFELAYVPGGGDVTLINTRGIAIVPPVAGESGTISSSAFNLTIGPPYGPYFRGPQNGTIQPVAGVSYSVANLGASTTNFNVAFAGINWLTATPSSGTLASGASTTVTLTPNANAASQNGGQTYTGNVVFKPGLSGGSGFTSRLATLVVDAFYIVPTTNFISVGEQGGTNGGFTPSSFVYVLSNATPSTLGFTAYLTNNVWATLSPTSGSVDAYGNQNLTISINANANSLTNIGSYVDQLVVTNVSASSALAIWPKITLQVGFGIFDDFSTYTAGNVVGQYNWTGNLDALKPVQITNSLFGGGDTNLYYAVPGGCVSASGSVQQPYKYVAAATMTNVDPTTYAIMGMSMTFTNGSPKSNYVFGMGSSFLTWSDDGIEDVGGGQYVWTSELNAYQTGGGAVGTLRYNYNTQYQVFMVADFVNSNSWVFVDPPGPSSGITDAVSLVNNVTPAVWSTGAGCSYCPGASAQGWQSVIVGQYSSCPDSVQPGYMVSKLAASTNWAAVYSWLNPASSCATITFTPSTGALPDGTDGTAYSQAISASGGTAPYTYTISAGVQPNGLSVDSAGGTLSGTPCDVAQGYSFTVQAVDASSCTGTVDYTLNVVCPTITLSSPPLAGGVVGGAYSQTITASGGTGPYSYAAGAGLAGSGLSLSSAGVLSGAPTAEGTYTFTVTATDTCGCTGSQAYSVTVISQYSSWQSFYGLSGTLSGGNASYTGDGMSNTNKVLAGFSPTSAAAYLRIISISKAVAAGATNVTVTYLGSNGDTNWVPGVALRTNVLDYCVGTANGSYNGTFLPVPAAGATNIFSNGKGLGVTASMTESNVPASSSSRYYRVRVLLP
jgi:hypothetical protein